MGSAYGAGGEMKGIAFGLPYTHLPQQRHKTRHRYIHIRQPAGAGHIFKLVPGGVNGAIECLGAQIGQVPVVVVKPGLVNQFGLDEGGEFCNSHIARVGKRYRTIFFIVAAIAVQVVELDVCHAAI